MRIIGGRYTVPEYLKKKSGGGLIRVLTLQLIVCALGISCFFALRAVNGELFNAVSTGKFGTSDKDGGFDACIERLASESPVLAVIFGVPQDESEQAGDTDENESEPASSAVTGQQSSVPESVTQQDTSGTETIITETGLLPVFGSAGLLYDVDLSYNAALSETDEETLSVNLPKYSLVAHTLPETPVRPLKNANLTDVFGLRINPVTGKQNFHTGIDLGGVASGTECYAVMSGTVKKAGSDRISGNYVILTHADGFTSCYCHLKKSAVATGDEITAGQTVGYVGNTGQSTGTHLHFHMMKDGVYLNPLNYFNYRPYNAD